MRLWPLALLRKRPAGRDRTQAILPLDEREAEDLRRHRENRSPPEERNRR